jgi:hypothetical protein
MGTPHENVNSVYRNHLFSFLACRRPMCKKQCKSGLWHPRFTPPEAARLFRRIGPEPRVLFRFGLMARECRP